jgi:serine phosphatase RsbU (regulator of sigma subunit)/Flp pilus assembly protein TadD
MRFLAAVLFLLPGLPGFSQTQSIDSLRDRLRNERRQDTMRVVDLNELAFQLVDYSVDSARICSYEALRISKKIGYLNGIIDAKNVQGIIYRYTNEPEKAIAIYFENIRLRMQQGRFDKLTACYSNLGSVYYESGDYAHALKYYEKAYENAVKFRQEDNQLVMLNNLGVGYKSAGLYEEAIATFRKGLELNKKLGDEFQEAQLYQNIGTVYQQQGHYKEATDSYLHSYGILKRSNSPRQLSGIVYNLSVTYRYGKDLKQSERFVKEMAHYAGILDEDDYTSLLEQTRANLYTELGRKEEALKAIDRSLALLDTTSELPQFADATLVRATCLLNLGRTDEALEACRLSESIFLRLNMRIELVNCYATRSEILKTQGNYKDALFYHEKSHNLQVTLATEEFNAQIAVMSSLNELDRKEREIALNKRRREKAELESRRQQLLFTGSVIIVFLVLGLLLFSIRAYRIKQRANVALNEQKDEIQSQKQLVDEKQKEILDSIQYARRIQDALLANRALMTEHLPESFVLFRPKDIVSGDFYWASVRGDRFYLAVCDSTGHGVPGAFMSLLNISFLNEAINEKGIVSPNGILDHVRQRLISNVSHDGARDGMDGTLLCFEKSTGKITYASAYNRPVIVRSGSVIAFPADKMPVGIGEKNDPFTCYELSYAPGDTLYLYTDGFPDQFGGPKGKKFKYRALDELLAANASEPLSDQMSLLVETFESWKGPLEQIDDVTLVGVRL